MLPQKWHVGSVRFSVSWKESSAELSCFTFLLRMKVALLSEDEVVAMYQVIGKTTLKLQMVLHTFISIYLGARSVNLLSIYVCHTDILKNTNYTPNNSS